MLKNNLDNVNFVYFLVSERTFTFQTVVLSITNTHRKAQSEKMGLSFLNGNSRLFYFHDFLNLE